MKKLFQLLFILSAFASCDSEQATVTTTTPAASVESLNRKARKQMRIDFFNLYQSKNIASANRLRYFDLLVAIKVLEWNSFIPFVEKAKAILINEAATNSKISKRETQRLRDVDINDDIEFKAKRMTVVDFVARNEYDLNELKTKLEI